MLQCGPFHWGITCGLFHDVIVACITLQRQVVSLARNQRKHAEIAGDIEVYGACLETRALHPQAPAGLKGLGGQHASRTECISRPAAHVRFATDNLRAAAPVEAGAGGGWLQRDARLYV